MYCVKCKSKTPNVGNLKIIVAKNGTKMSRATCAHCGTMKSQIMGKGIGRFLSSLF